MSEIINNFHFAQPLYLLLFLALPLCYYLTRKLEKLHSTHHLDYHKYKKLATFNNLKHLVKANNKLTHKIRWLLLGLFLSLIILTLAQPRWRYHTTELISQNNNIVILLDSSSSMNVKDIAPNRYDFSKAKINYMLNNIDNSRIALIAFTDIPHLIAPLTKDYQALTNKLAKLTTSNFKQQGTNINAALQLAINLYRDFAGDNNYIILFTDGDFELELADQLSPIIKKKKLNFFSFLIGTEIGGPVYQDNKILTYQNQNIYSKANAEKLNKLTKSLAGNYLKTSQNDDDIKSLLKLLQQNIKQHKEKEKIKIWEEGFYIFLVPALLILLYYYRFALCLILIFLFNQEPAQANIFLNQAQKGTKLFSSGNYQAAQENFTTPYNKGVAAYKNQDFATAIKEFSKEQKYDLKNKFNLANSYFMSENYSSAIKQYEEILANDKNHPETLYNLKIAKEKLERQEATNKQTKPQEKNSKNQDNQQEEQHNSKQLNQIKQNNEKQQNPENKDNNSNVENNLNNNKKLEDKKQNQQQEPIKPDKQNKHNSEKNSKAEEKIDNYDNILKLIENSAEAIMQQKIRVKEENSKVNLNNNKPW